MSMIIWILAGALLGWIAYSFLDMSPGRGQWVSLLIGAMGGVLGGKEVAPIFIAASVPETFSAPTLAIAAVVAAAFLFAASFIYNRWGV